MNAAAEDEARPRGVRLDRIVPWGRGLAEYERMFLLDERQLRGRLLDCGGGPASFSAEVVARGGHAVSADPLYQFTHAQIRQRIDETFDIVVEKTRAAQDGYYWDQVKSVEELGRLRMAAMAKFLDDFEEGRRGGRYVVATLPRLPFANHSFDLALCSHLLFTYGELLDTEAHIASVLELLRVAMEVRVFPLVNIDGSPSPHLEPLLEALHGAGYRTERRPTQYRMQKGAEHFLVATAQAAGTP